MGLLEQATPPSQPSSPSSGEKHDTAADPLLNQVIKGVEAKVPANLKDGFNRILAAGEAVLWSDKTHKFLTDGVQRGLQQKQLAQAIAQGIGKLMVVIQKNSRGQMQLAAAFPAAIVLMAEAADFAEKSTGQKATPEIVAMLTKMTTAEVAKNLGVTKEKLAAGIALSRQQGQQPTGTPPAQPPAQPAAQPAMGG